MLLGMDSWHCPREWVTLCERSSANGGGEPSTNSSISCTVVELILREQKSSDATIPLIFVFRVTCILCIITFIVARLLRLSEPRPSSPNLIRLTSVHLGSSHGPIRSILGYFRSIFGSLMSVVHLPGSYSGPLSSIPGPWTVPVLGSLAFFLRGNWYRTMDELRQKYGDIYRLQIGSRPVIVLHGRRAVEGALVGGLSRVFAGRPDLKSFRLASEGKSMSFNGYSEEWRIHRRLAERVARAMYTNRSFVQSCLSVETQHLRDLFLVQADRGTPYNPDEDLLWSVAHVQYSLCYGNSHRDDSFEDMITNTIRLIGCHNKGNLVDFFPWAKRLLRFQEEALERICDKMLSITKQKHSEHQRSFTRGRIRDMLDALLEFGVNGKNRLGLDEMKIVLTVQEFIGAGLDIVHAALHWTVLYAARHENIQRRIQAEIQDVIGRQRTPTRNDMPRMPFTVAFIAEMLRHSSVVPLALPHSTTKDTYLDGHFVPADTMVLVNLRSVNHDEDTWTRPEVFNPERFLETQSDGTLRFRGGESAFGFGWRRCVGAELSRLELFLYLTTLLQSCRITLAPGTPESDLDEPRIGIVLRPKPFSILVTRR